MESTSKLSRATKALIKETIIETNSYNRYTLCERIAEKLEIKFPGLNLDYKLKQMNLETTKQILEAIDTYFYKYAR